MFPTGIKASYKATVMTRMVLIQSWLLSRIESVCEWLVYDGKNQGQNFSKDTEKNQLNVKEKL